MLARRIIAVSGDKAFAKQIAGALRAAGGAAESHADIEALGSEQIDAALLVWHITADDVGAVQELLLRLSEECRVIAILPTSNLIEIVAMLQRSEQIVGIMIADGLAQNELTAMAARAVTGDIFGLEKLMPWGTRVHSTLVGDYQEKSVCIAAVSEFAQMMGVRRKYRESIEQCLDEMLMNALYDAPVDDQGRQIFADVPTKTRITLRLEQRAVVQYACDAKHFAISVRDTFGMLERGTVVKYLHKCLHSEQQIDRKTGGAGLGLYLMANSASRVAFHVLPGVATEAVCIFHLDSPKVHLESFAFLHEKIDAAVRLTSGPSRLLPSASPETARTKRAANAASNAATWPWMLASVLMGAAAALGVVAVPKLLQPSTASVALSVVPAGAQIEVEGRVVGVASDGPMAIPGLTVGKSYPIVAKLEGYQPQAITITAGKDQAVPVALQAINPVVHIASTPSGANVEIDSREMGKTPLKLDSVSPNAKVAATFRLDGYNDLPYSFDAPGPGKTKEINVPLSVAADFATIVVTSNPPGADIFLNGQLLAGKKTPSEPFLVKAGVEHTIALKRANFTTATLSTKPARGENNVMLEATLVPGITLTVMANLDGKFTINSAAECKSVAVPGSCQVKAGEFDVEFAIGSAAGASVKRKVKVAATTSFTFTLGFVEAAAGTSLMLANGTQTKRLLLEQGRQTITVLDVETSSIRKVNVMVLAGKTTPVQ